MGPLWQFARFGLTALGMLLLKLALTALFTQALTPLVAYLLVQVLLTGISYCIHAYFTFRQAQSWRGFFAYARVVILFQILDYLIFAVLFSTLQIDALLAVFAATVLVFLVRFVAVRQAFLPSEQALDHERKA